MVHRPLVTPASRLSPLTVAFALVALTPIPVLSQAAVAGRVTLVGSDLGIPNAIVELVGHGATLTTVQGAFLFEDVARRSYTLRVTAFGYVTLERPVTVDDDLTLSLPLDADPLPLDSLIVESRLVDVDGRVRDRAVDAPIYNADVLVNQEPVDRTSPRGRFDTELWMGVPVLLSVRVFGYLPIDTVVVPAMDDRYEFELARDPIIDAMLAEQVARLEARRTGQPAIGARPLVRERLLRWTGYSLSEVFEFSFETRRISVGCLIIDEEPVPAGWDGMVLQSTLPGDIERVEFLFGGSMVRVYTREFMRNLVAGIAELEEPTFVGAVSPPLCR